uniref:(northern house mosquito) hypothetical protein n=1 Tax=Culex pipiens TaxID=7175 RepID=A0A8D8PD17_CULPI
MPPPPPRDGTVTFFRVTTLPPPLLLHVDVSVSSPERGVVELLALRFEAPLPVVDVGGRIDMRCFFLAASGVPPRFTLAALSRSPSASRRRFSGSGTLSQLDTTWFVRNRAPANALPQYWHLAPELTTSELLVGDGWGGVVEFWWTVFRCVS